MKVLVTGGAGFIGSHLCDALLQSGHEVTAIDNFITGRKQNLAHLHNEHRFNFIEADITTTEFDLPVDQIYHLASPASPLGYGRNPLQTLAVNSMGTQRMLELATRHNARFLITSTSEIYGDPLEHPQRETYFGNVNSIGPRACYDESKRFAEAITIEYMRQFQLSVRITRLFNTYGPRVDPLDGRVVPNFITQALTNQPLTIYGDGSQTRSFCYVSDLVRGLLLVMNKEGLDGEVFNLGNPDERTILDFAGTILKHIPDSSAQIVHLPLPLEDPTRRRPDITKAKTLLGWQPEVSLDEGISRTIKWYSQEEKLVTTSKL